MGKWGKALVAVAALVMMSAAQAALFARPGGMVYDSTLNITWLSNWNQGAGSAYDNGASTSDGLMTWENATGWANSLVYGGYDDWRLPSTTQPDPTCSNAFSPGGGFPLQYYGYFCTGSEMGHLYYEDLEAEALGDILAGSNKANLALFTSMQLLYYWSATEIAWAPGSGAAWLFYTSGRFTGGYQDRAGTSTEMYAVAVRDGDVGYVPEPMSLGLVGVALGGLVAVRRRYRRIPMA